MNKIDPRALRTAFGSFMSGVTVVTALGLEGQPIGFTANSFSSVSLDPPLLLVCPGKFLSSYDAFINCRHFAVNILAEGDEEVSNTFASFKGDRFAQIRHRPDLHSVPLIDGAVAQFSCVTHKIIEVGDHSILIGQVKDYSHVEKPGLGYVGGQYFSLGLERAALAELKGTAVCGAIIEDNGLVLLEETQKGFRPPQVTSTDRDSLRSSLCKALSAHGIAAQLGQAYSVFDDPQNGRKYSYFLASGSVTTHESPEQTPGQGRVQAVGIRDLTGLTFTLPAIAQMMARYALEAQTRSFGLYIGDAQHGDVHSQSERI